MQNITITFLSNGCTRNLPPQYIHLHPGCSEQLRTSTSIQNDVSSANGATQTVFSVPSLGEFHVIVTIPDDSTKALIKHKGSIPSPAQIQFLDTPSDSAKRDNGDASNNLSFMPPVFIGTSVVYDLGREDKAWTLVIIVFTALLVLGNCTLEWYKSLGTPTPPSTTVPPPIGLPLSRPLSRTLSLALHGTAVHAVLMRIVHQVSAFLPLSTFLSDGSWGSSTTTTLNTILNNFYEDVRDPSEILFAGTHLEPMQDFSFRLLEAR
ncbi:hypothetical protein BJ322DRAFT_1109107 [Thelephora terrestris]|uniref:Uncharacterized protein n=1 Tax=Thelephora terrestris TaxID=56493 RepID=A0A9P6HD61_9AGAM|nr:hypothetical protein BJ322DRAFT_1109107 [Thelephora terrestris]